MTSARTAPFYGREHELQSLQELAPKKTAGLVIIKGRRRIGKSRLATEFARRLPGYGALSFQGLPPTAQLTAWQEREDFAQQINRQLGIPAPRADVRQPFLSAKNSVLIHAGALAASIAEQEYFSSVIDFGDLMFSLPRSHWQVRLQLAQTRLRLIFARVGFGKAARLLGCDPTVRPGAKAGGRIGR